MPCQSAAYNSNTRQFKGKHLDWLTIQNKARDPKEETRNDYVSTQCDCTQMFLLHAHILGLRQSSHPVQMYGKLALMSGHAMFR